MPRSLPIVLLVAAALGAGAAPAGAQDAVPDQVVVQYDGAAAPQVVPTAPGESVAGAIQKLRRSPDVRYAVPNVIAHASGFIPNDPGRDGPGGWQAIQWNFLAS